MHIPRLHKPTIKSLRGDRRNFAKAHGLVLSCQNRNNADGILEDFKQIDLFILAAYILARAKKMGRFRIKTIAADKLSTTELTAAKCLEIVRNIRKTSEHECFKKIHIFFCHINLSTIFKD